MTPDPREATDEALATKCSPPAANSTWRRWLLPALAALGLVAAYFSAGWLVAAVAAYLLVEWVCRYYERIRIYTGRDLSQVQVRRVVEDLHLRTHSDWPEGYLRDGDLSPQDLMFHPPNAEVEGSVMLPSIGRRHRFRYGTDDLGRRRTSPEVGGGSDRPRISIYGASATFGFGLDDDQTFPWHVQKAFPEYEVVNHAVEGFSLYEMWLMMRHTFRMEPTLPAHAVVVVHPNSVGRDTAQYPSHHWIHGPRCISLRLPWQRERQLFHLPPSRLARYARRAPTRPLEVLLSSALALPVLPRNWRAAARETTRHVLLEIQRLCEHREVPLLVLYLGARDGMCQFLEEREFQWTCAGFSSTAPDEDGRYPFSLFPFDPNLHPNGEANRRYAAALSQLLDSAAAGTPPPTVLSPPREREEFDKFVYPLF